mgnify:FL=1
MQAIRDARRRQAAAGAEEPEGSGLEDRREDGGGGGAGREDGGGGGAGAGGDGDSDEEEAMQQRMIDQVICTPRVLWERVVVSCGRVDAVRCLPPADKRAWGCDLQAARPIAPCLDC